MKKFLIFLTACFLLIVTYFGISETIRKYQIEKNYKIAEEMIKHIYKKELGIDIVITKKSYDNAFPNDLHDIYLSFHVKNKPDFKISSRVILKKSMSSRGTTLIDAILEGGKISASNYTASDFVKTYLQGSFSPDNKNNVIYTGPYFELFHDGPDDGPYSTPITANSLDTFIKDYDSEPFIQEIYKKYNY